MKVAVHHCYLAHGPRASSSWGGVHVAGSEALLEAKVRGAVSSFWEEEDSGPMPLDFSELMDICAGDYDVYVCDWGFTVLDVADCDPFVVGV